MVWRRPQAAEPRSYATAKKARKSSGLQKPTASLLIWIKTHKHLVWQIYLRHVGQTSFKLDIPNLAKGDRAAILKL